MKNLKLIVIIAAVAAVIGATAYYLTRPAPTPPPPGPTTPPSQGFKPPTSPPPSAAPTPTPPSAHTQTYSDAKNGFSIIYPDTYLAVTDRQKIQASGYIPVCDPDTSVLCLIYPSETLSGTNFDNAGVSVNILGDRKNAGTCLAVSGNMKAAGSVTINGTVFQSFTDGDAAMGHQSSGDDYLAFHAGRCFELTSRVYTTTFENYQAGTIQRFTDQMRATVEASLKATAYGFAFTK